MRIAVDALVGRGDADFAEPRERLLPRLPAPERLVGQDRLGKLIADAHERVEAGQRVLEDDADAPAADRAHPRRRQIVDALAVEPDFAAGDPAWRVKKADDGEAGQRLAGAGFADDPENLARRNVERDAVERDERPLSRCEFDAEIANREQRPGHFSLGLSASRNQSPSRFTASTRAASVRLGKATIHHSPENR